MTNYNPKAKATKSARTIRLRNAHQAMCSFHDMTENRNFRVAQKFAEEAINAIERAANHAGIPREDVVTKSEIDARLAT